MIRFLNITIQCKSVGDWRAFLDWADSDIMMRYQIRGYGITPGTAADDAWAKFNDDREFFTDSIEEWK